MAPEPDMLRDLIEKGLVDYVAMDIKALPINTEQIARSPVNLGEYKGKAQSFTDARSRRVFLGLRTTVWRGAKLSAEDIEKDDCGIPGRLRGIWRFYNRAIFWIMKVSILHSSEEMEELGGSYAST